MERRHVGWGVTTVLITCVGMFAAASAAQAQPPATNPNQMCGTGETFTVTLPGLPRAQMGIDDPSGIFRSIEVPETASADSVTLPKGCRIYAFLISGFGDNAGYDHIVFYKVAEFVARNNGYVHVGWWNNLTKEYMERPLHNDPITLRKFIGEDVVIFPTPKTEGIPDAFLDLFLELPKANPDDDYQFQQDARLVLKAVRAENPDALIIVVGHSMGGNAVARLAAENEDVSIDLLAPIDPVGNRDTPRVYEFFLSKFNWTRWRATHNFRGWKIRDCIRTNEPAGTGLCRNFGTFFSPSFKCTTRGDWLPDLPLIGSRQVLLCPGAYEDDGPQLTIGRNVRHLYHRWQSEFVWPVDFEDSYRFHRAPRSFASTTGGILAPNYQAPVLRSPLLPNPLAPNDPHKTCSAGTDPRDDRFPCNPTDGHGEIIGVRTDGGLGRVRPGLKLTNWPERSSTFTPGQRRGRLIQLAVDGAEWPYRPENPDLCLVCDDIIAITQHLMAQQTEEAPADTAPPASQAASTPEVNARGWFNEDVIVSVSATDAGSGVQSIHLSLSGAQTGTAATNGSSASTTITAEGTTTVEYFARDAAGNEEPPNALTIQIDKTTPQVTAQPSLLPNVHGWIGAPVVITFTASDEEGGSGLASSSPTVTVSTEGEGQEITGAAEDNAGNVATTLLTVNVDLTPPTIALEGRAPSANTAGWTNSPVTLTWTCSDALSGVLAASQTVIVSSEGAAQSATGTCQDRAGHAATASVGEINIDLTAPGVALMAPLEGATYLLNAVAPAAYACTDALSGVASCTGTVANGAGLDTATPGLKTFTVTTTDAAGNAFTVTRTYAVRYHFTGLAAPIGSGINQVHAGRTVPVKFALLDAGGAPISSLAAFVSLTSDLAACETGEVLEVAGEVESSGDTGIRYDAEAGQFVYTWKTNPDWTGTCRILKLTLADGTVHAARFRFR